MDGRILPTLAVFAAEESVRGFIAGDLFFFAVPRDAAAELHGEHA